MADKGLPQLADRAHVLQERQSRPERIVVRRRGRACGQRRRQRAAGAPEEQPTGGSVRAHAVLLTP